jgi:hypothetical protein
MFKFTTEASKEKTFGTLIRGISESRGLRASVEVRGDIPLADLEQNEDERWCRVLAAFEDDSEFGSSRPKPIKNHQCARAT